jgi:hypothetical protein
MGGFQGAYQAEANCILALPALREKAIFQKGGLVHQAMRRMFDAIDSADRNDLTRFVPPVPHVYRAAVPTERPKLSHYATGIHR